MLHSVSQYCPPIIIVHLIISCQLTSRSCILNKSVSFSLQYILLLWAEPLSPVKIQIIPYLLWRILCLTVHHASETPDITPSSLMVFILVSLWSYLIIFHTNLTIYRIFSIIQEVICSLKTSYSIRPMVVSFLLCHKEDLK